MISNLLAYAVYWFCDALATLILVEAIMSWFVSAMPYPLRRIYGMLHQLTEPFLLPFRKALQKVTYSAGLDISPVFAILVLQLIGKLAWILLRSL